MSNDVLGRLGTSRGELTVTRRLPKVINGGRAGEASIGVVIPHVFRIHFHVERLVHLCEYPS